MLSSSPPTIDRPGNGDQCRLVSTPTTNGTQPVQAGGIVPGSDQPPLYLPDFLQNLIDHLEEFDFPVRQAQAKEVSEFDFLTVDLKEEIELQFPSNEDKEPTTGRRLVSSFQEKAGQLFPVGQVWANYVQLTQALSYFCQAWAVSTVHSQKKIRCHFGQATKKKKQSTAPVEKQRTPRTSTKAIQCPFEIHYSFLSVVKSKDDPSWRPDLFYQAKITFAEQSPLFHVTSDSSFGVDTFR